MPIPSDPPRVWKNEPGRRGGRYWVTSGENVSASSKMIASSGSRAARASMNSEAWSGTPARASSVGVARGDVGLVAGRAPGADPAVGGLAAGRRPLLAEGDGERGEGELRVADEAEVDREVLGDLVRVEVDVDDPGARREDAR